MGLEKKLDYCLADFVLRQWVEQGKIIVSSDLDKNKCIQPASFDPCLSDELFILDTEIQGVFRSRPDETVYRTLLGLPNRQRERVTIPQGGFEIKKGYAYLARLDMKLKLTAGEYARASPKSSLGRVFLDTRLVADYNRGFDQVLCSEGCGIERDLWLLLQPLAFNLLLRPGITLNQLRMFTGPDAILTPSEVMEEFRQHALLYRKNPDSSLEPARPVVTDDGLQLHLNLLGQDTCGVVSFRARKNPNPIDLAKKELFNANDYFEPVIGQDRRISVEPGQHYLIASQEVLDIPAHLNAELAAYSNVGIRGPLHFAGFVDNGFQGDLVFEVRPDELSRMVLEHGMPISWLRFYRTQRPEKLYGKEIGSHYQKQVGPKLSKYFSGFDFGFAAKNYSKLDRVVLVQDARQLMRHRKTAEGFEELKQEDATALFEDIRNGFFHSRFDCEDDLLALQPIPYLVIFGHGRRVFSYERTGKIKDYGEAKLFGKLSVGIGGHILKDDGPDYIETCMRRELEEEVAVEGRLSTPRFVGTLIAQDKPVDRVHFGLVYVAYTDGVVRPNEKSIVSGEMVKVHDLWTPFGCRGNYETWSRIIIENFIPVEGQALLSAHEDGIKIDVRD
ncbi:2'-deoxycytidine 5'-triphosphate deaminase [Candidatus Woesearchaeota archaeon]|nr:2'-deoxycytidine 5'-triphosphate deaminase [Candidatus Woesearchaeota archaeon]